MKLEGEYDLLPDNELTVQTSSGGIAVCGHHTRPDITAAIGILCRRVSNPRQRDWNALKRVMRYLKQTLSLKLKISADHNLDLVGYVDADWGGDMSDSQVNQWFLLPTWSKPDLVV